MSERLIDDLLAVIAREVGPVSLYARIEIERAVHEMAAAAAYVPWGCEVWEIIEPETKEKPDAAEP